MISGLKREVLTPMVKKIVAVRTMEILVAKFNGRVLRANSAMGADNFNSGHRVAVAVVADEVITTELRHPGQAVRFRTVAAEVTHRNVTVAATEVAVSSEIAVVTEPVSSAIAAEIASLAHKVTGTLAVTRFFRTSKLSQWKGFWSYIPRAMVSCVIPRKTICRKSPIRSSLAR